MECECGEENRSCPTEEVLQARLKARGCQLAGLQERRTCAGPLGIACRPEHSPYQRYCRPGCQRHGGDRQRLFSSVEGCKPFDVRQSC